MRILNVKYDNLTFEGAIKQTLSLLKQNKKSEIFFLNADCLYKAQKDEEYRNILSSASLVLPDGIGLELVTWLFGGKMQANCNGTDFSPALMKRAAQNGYTVFFLGARDGVAEKAAEGIRKEIPGLKITGTHCGYFKNDSEIIEKINVSGADILFVAMGVPLQEKWIFHHRSKLHPNLCLGVGSLFDYLSGRIRRAPRILRLLYLEWFWRILIEPRRMIKRYIIDGAKFFLFTFRQRLFN